MLYTVCAVCIIVNCCGCQGEPTQKHNNVNVDDRLVETWWHLRAAAFTCFPKDWITVLSVNKVSGCRVGCVEHAAVFNFLTHFFNHSRRFWHHSHFLVLSPLQLSCVSLVTDWCLAKTFQDTSPSQNSDPLQCVPLRSLQPSLVRTYDITSALLEQLLLTQTLVSVALCLVLIWARCVGTWTQEQLWGPGRCCRCCLYLSSHPAK